MDATVERLEQRRSQGVGEQQLRDVSEAVRGQRWWARQAEAAELFWVTGDMARLALDASQDVPGFDPISRTGRAGRFGSWSTGRRTSRDPRGRRC